MANFWFLPGLEAWADGEVSWTKDEIRLFAIDKSNWDANENMSALKEVPPSAVVAEGEVTGRTCVNGELRGKPPVWDELYGNPISAVVIVKVETPIEQSRLLLYIDEGTRFPLQPNGTQLTFFWKDDHIADL